MKPNYFLLTICCITIAFASSNIYSQSCVNQWSQQNSGVSTQLTSVSAVSDNVGWAAGLNATIRRTIDGSTWINANPNANPVNTDVHCIAGIDANTALCVTYPLEANIYRTVDGGVTWTRVYTLNQAAIHSIQMISATEGYALGDPHPVGQKYIILKTVDGGVTWNRIPTEPMASNALEGTYDNSFFILGSNMWFGTNNSLAYHSSDMGATWSSASTPGTTNVYAVHYNTPLMGLAGGNTTNSNAIVRSNDGGITYSSATAPPTNGIIKGIEGVDDKWWIIRTNIDVLYSSDQGTTWTVVYSQLTGYFQHLDFTIVNGCPTGWAVGNAGVIAKMSSMVTNVNTGSEIPESFSLNQNYPNPFNPTTNLEFGIPELGFVSLKIYDANGKEVKTLVNENKSPGRYLIQFNGNELSSGVYYYKLEAGDFRDTKKMILLK